MQTATSAEGTSGVAQTFQSAVSPTFQSAGHPNCAALECVQARQVGKRAIQQTGKSALRFWLMKPRDADGNECRRDFGRSANFPVCRIADFPVGGASELCRARMRPSSAGWKTCDTADWKVCATVLADETAGCRRQRVPKG